MKIKFIAIFILITTFVFLVLNYEKNIKIEEYLQKEAKEYNSKYNIIYQHFRDKAHIIYDTTIQTQDVIEIYKKLKTSTDEQKAILRDELFKLLKDKYKRLGYTKLQQLHFHLESNESFLRFHKPNKFGDNLTSFRETIKYVNKNNKYIDGFEAGKILTGYRFVFPLNGEDKSYLGSVEISFKSSAFTNEFMDKFNVVSNLHIKKEIIEKKVWKENIIKNYIKSPFDGYYMEKAILNKLINFYHKDLTKTIINKKGIDEIIKNASSYKIGAFYSENLKKIIVTKQIINPVTKKTVAFLTIRACGDYINNKIINYRFAFFVITFFVMIILILIYRELLHQKSVTLLLKKKVALKTKELENVNDTLEKRIKIEVKKNREKDNILFQQSKMASMGEMIANIAHQWRQPLAIINTIVAILNEKNKRGDITQENLTKKLNEIEIKTIYMSQTIEDFLSYFKPNKEKKIFLLHKTIDNTLLIINQLISKNDIKLSINIEKELKINGFEDEFIQVLIAIITNSVQAFNNEKDKTIVIDAKKSNKHILLSISDNAGGISEDIIDKIFEPYFTTKHKSQGTGLGLYMSKMLCENSMGGVLSVENIKDGVKFSLKFLIENLE
ncbi:MAG: ATP-binding protein [Campylobacterota bacterium]|nr:ATP-binding protein [Campylobacterota bacterium]